MEASGGLLPIEYEAGVGWRDARICVSNCCFVVSRSEMLFRVMVKSARLLEYRPGHSTFQEDAGGWMRYTCEKGGNKF
jgi:hypothetical protein